MLIGQRQRLEVVNSIFDLVSYSIDVFQINEAYVNKSGQCAANMDILSSLMESPQFSFNYDNSEISFVPCL